MSMKYELSIWRDYPGSTGIQEEKIGILAATGMDFAGRAQNIKLKREYTGRITLEFEIPVKYFDPFGGETVVNPLCKKVVEKTKVKLWRDELWFNPFGGESTYDEETGCTKYKGAWIQGRWYDLVVNSHREKRTKKQLFYSYTCDSLFANELSRNGYGLQFVPDTDIMSVNGMGTAHDLAKRIVEGTDWEYIKTEVFPDFKEEFNAVTGETVKTPVSTDRIEFAGGLDRYCYCYEVEVEEVDEQNNILGSINSQLKNHKIDNNITNNYYGFTNNKFWWKDYNGTEQKKYALGHIKTDISFNGADSIISMDSGDMTIKSGINKDIPTGATDISRAAHLWTAVSGSVNYEGKFEEGNSKHSSYLKLSGNGEIVYKQAVGKSLNQGNLYCIKVATEEAGQKIDFRIAEHLTGSDNEVLKIENMELTNSSNAYEKTYWFTAPTYVSAPYFYIKNRQTDLMTIKGIYLYEFKGASKEINNLILDRRSKSNATYGTINVLLEKNGGQGYEQTEITNNAVKINEEYSPIWLGFGKTTVEGYQEENYTYLIEYNIDGNYYQIYLPINNNNKVKLTKLSSYNTDKRRAIKGEKSNRFSLLETVAKTFNCFTRFIVEHDSQGRILREYGRPVKRFTFVSELGRKNFNGFNYGVNLDNIERTIDANNLVTKCHVENISNEYSNSNMITIQESKYNKLGMTYIYNFSYYLNRGLLNKERFLKDYQQFTDDLHRLTQANLTKIEQNGGIITKKTMLETDISTYELMLEAYKDTVKQSLSTIGWERFVNGEIINDVFYYGHNPNKSGHPEHGNISGIKDEDFVFPTIKIASLCYYNDEGPTGYSYYLEDKPIYISKDSPNKPPEGKYKIPNRFKNINELAQYIAYNCVGSVRSGDDSGVPPHIPGDDLEFWGRGLSKDTIENELDKIFETQANYNSTQKSLNMARQELQEVTAKVDEYNKFIDKNNKEIQRKITQFERKYTDYIIEGQWRGQDYIDADAYYLDATRAMSVSCMPKVSYTIGAVDLSQLANPYDPTDTDWGKEFTYDVGDTSYVKDEELFGNTEQLTMIATITSYVDLNKQDDIEMRNYETRFEELFQQVAAAVTSVQFNENIWGKAAGFTPDGGIDETILQTAFNNNKNLVIASANNSVTQDNKGITVTDNDTGKILRLIGGGLFVSGDGGVTYKAGITPDGINALMITTGQLDTSKIVIRSTDTPNFELTSQGLTAFSSIAESRFTRFDQFGVYSTDMAQRFAKDWWIGKDTPEDYIITNSIFSLTRKGLNFKYTKGGLTLGTIDSTKGLYGLKIIKEGETVVQLSSDSTAIIGNWTINATSIVSYKEQEDGSKIQTTIISSNGNQTGFYTYGGDKTDTAKQDWRIWCGPGDLVPNSSVVKGYFGVDKEGKLYATNAIIWGTIFAGEGRIANWNMSGDYLWAGDHPSEQESATSVMIIRPTATASGGPGSDVIVCRVDGIDNFRLNSDGTVTANKLIAKGAHIEGSGVFTGTITAGSGKIGGWNIYNNILYSYPGRYMGSGFMGGTGEDDNPFFYTGYDKERNKELTGKDSEWPTYAFNWVTNNICKMYINQKGDIYSSGMLMLGPDPNATFGYKFVYDTANLFIDGHITARTLTLTGEAITTIKNISAAEIQATKIKASQIIAGQIATTDTGRISATYMSLGGTWLTNEASIYTYYYEPNNDVRQNEFTRSRLRHIHTERSAMTIVNTYETRWYDLANYNNVAGSGSDIRIKKDIEYCIDKYEAFFNELKPCRYKYIEGTSNRFHTGFVAQDIVSALENNNLTTQEFAGVYLWDEENGERIWHLRRDEFVALNTWQIQKLKARVTELEQKLESLTSLQ